MLKLRGKFINQTPLQHYDHLTMLRFLTKQGDLSVLVNDEQFMDNFISETAPISGQIWDLKLWEQIVPQLGIMVFKLSSARLVATNDKESEKVDQESENSASRAEDQEEDKQLSSAALQDSKLQDEAKHKPEPINQYDDTMPEDNNNDLNGYDANAGMDDAVPLDEYSYDSELDPKHLNRKFDMNYHEPKHKTAEDEAVEAGDADEVAAKFSEHEAEETEDEGPTNEIPDLGLGQ